jgi:NADH dehydrogenase
MILVVGATGTLGGLVARRLLDAGQPVRALVRDAGAAAALATAGAEPVRGDLTDAASLRVALAGVHTVITTANSARRAGADTVESVDRAGNHALIEIARSAGVRQFVFVSALGASASSPVPFIQAKSETEERLRASGVPFTIVAPNAFMEVWAAGVVGAPARAGQPVVLVGEGRRRHSFVSVRDVAAFTAAAVGHDAALGQYLPVGGPDALTWRDVVAAYARALGREVPVRWVAPGEPVPGLPDPMQGMLAAFETYDSPVEMAELARTFGVALTPLDAFVRADLGLGGEAGGDTRPA